MKKPIALHLHHLPDSGWLFFAVVENAGIDERGAKEWHMFTLPTKKNSAPTPST